MVVRHDTNLGKTTELCLDQQHVARIGRLCATEDAPPLSGNNLGYHFTESRDVKGCCELIPSRSICLRRQRCVHHSGATEKGQCSEASRHLGRHGQPLVVLASEYGSTTGRLHPVRDTRLLARNSDQ